MINARIGLMLLSLALSVAIGLVVARKGGAAADETTHAAGQRLVIGLSLDTLKEARWQRDRDLMKARADALGADLLVQSANSDDARQIADVQALITRRVNVLVVVPHDGTAMAKAVAMAHESGIPVLAYDRMIRDADVDLYVSFDNVRVGELQARYLVDHLPTPGKGRIVRIYGSKADNNAHLFKDGQDGVLAPYIARHDIQVIHEDWAEDWKQESAKKIVNAAISEHGTHIDGILASNDGTAGGAIQALSEEGLAGQDPRHRAGRGAGRLPADRRRDAGDDGLQADPARGRVGDRRSRCAWGRGGRSSRSRPSTTARSTSRRSSSTWWSRPATTCSTRWSATASTRGKKSTARRRERRGAAPLGQGDRQALRGYRRARRRELRPRARGDPRALRRERRRQVDVDQDARRRASRRLVTRASSRSTARRRAFVRCATPSARAWPSCTRSSRSSTS